MHLRMSTFLLVFLLILNILSSGELAKVEGFGNGVKRKHSLEKGAILGKNRKILVLDAELDYDYAGPNPKHDPRGKKPGAGGSKNP